MNITSKFKSLKIFLNQWKAIRSIPVLLKISLPKHLSNERIDIMIPSGALDLNFRKSGTVFKFLSSELEPNS